MILAEGVMGTRAAVRYSGTVAIVNLAGRRTCW